MCDDNFPQLVITDLGQNNLSDKLLLPLGLQSQCIFFCNISIPGQPSTAVESGNTWMRPRGQQLWQSVVTRNCGSCHRLKGQCSVDSRPDSQLPQSLPQQQGPFFQGGEEKSQRILAIHVWDSRCGGLHFMLRSVSLRGDCKLFGTS